MENISLKLRVLDSCVNMIKNEMIYSTTERRGKLSNALIVMNDIISDYSKAKSLTEKE